MNDPRIIVALDYPDAASALQLVQRLDPALCRLKVGKELFTAAGPDLVRVLIDKEFGVFLDLKFHDIPNTVAKACEAASKLGVWMLNVHAAGGAPMMVAAKEAVQKVAHPPLLIAVTVLTSMTQTVWSEIGFHEDIQASVLRFAQLAQASGLDGVVCSAQEAPLLRAALGTSFQLVTPGIRPAAASLDDQARVQTPAAAITNGSSYLVIGRPITQAMDPLLALQKIHAEIQTI